MSGSGTIPHNDSRLARLLMRSTLWCSRHPWRVLVLCVISLALSIQQSCTRLQYRTQRDDLMNADKEFQVRWRNYVGEFGNDNDIIVVVEGRNRERMQSAVDRLAAKFR